MKPFARLFAFLFVIAIAFSSLCLVCTAETDDVGNQTVLSSASENIDCEGDYLYASITEITESEPLLQGRVGGDFLGVFYSARLQTEIGGNLRAAGYKALYGSKVGKNATVAGVELKFDDNFSCLALYAAGETVNFSGNAECLRIAGGTVWLGGTVTGTVYVTATTVYIMEGFNADPAKITIESAIEPISVFENDVQKPLSQSEKFSSISFKKTESSYDVRTAFGNLLYTLPSALISVLLMTLFLGKVAERAGKRFLQRKGATIGFGFALLFVLPMAAVFGLLAAGMGIGTGFVSFLFLCVWLLLFAVSESFACASLSRVLMPKLNKYLSSLVLMTGVTVLSIIPFVGTVLFVICMLFTFGSLITGLFLNKPQQPTDSDVDFTV